jgi:hypothetical protein
VIFTYLDAVELTTCRQINHSWKFLSDESSHWEFLCQILWNDKQNIPIHPWVLVEEIYDDSEEIARNKMELVMLQMLYVGSMTSPSDDDILARLLFIRKQSARREAAPIVNVLREEQIQLENQLVETDDIDERSVLVFTIIANMNTPLKVSNEDLNAFIADDRLLTWRESYIASLIDSTRCCLTFGVRTKHLLLYSSTHVFITMYLGDSSHWRIPGLFSNH